jgi:hypothetical protein
MNTITRQRRDNLARSGRLKDPLTHRTADDLIAWANNNSWISAGENLLRLVQRTGIDLSNVNFRRASPTPANLYSWDYWIESGTAQAWIPLGASGWKFGIANNFKHKAQEDYAGLASSVSVASRRDITFVFVTPRTWPDRHEWAKSRRAEGIWKDVSVLDASDLARWYNHAQYCFWEVGPFLLFSK